MTVKRALKLRQDGEYILDLDIDELRERLKQRAEKTAQDIMTLEAERYEALFDELGMTPDQKARALQHIQAIIKAKIDAGHALSSLAAAQMDLEGKMKAALGPKYDAYAKYEADDLGRREARLAQEFLQARQVDCSTEDLIALEKVMNATGCFSDRSLNSYGGPFNGLQPRTSGGMSLAGQEQRLAEFQSSIQALPGNEQFKALPAAIKDTVQQYYADEVATMKENIFLTRYPELREVVEAENRLRKMKANPAANPITISQLEAIVVQLKSKYPGIRW